jgi:DDE superfamily endonuclease
MPAWIVAHSDELCNFLIPLLAGFSAPQLRHALNFVDAILVCIARHKTLAALTRLLRLDHADEFAWADFFRVSPWSGETVRTAVTRFLLQTVVALQARTGWRLLFLSVDDSLCVKDVDTTKLQAVSFFYDHNEPRRQQGRFSNASKYVALHLQLGAAQWLLTWRPYYKRSQVKTLNRQRRSQGRTPLAYTSLITLVEQMLDEIAPHLPPACHVYVLFDSWYASQPLYTFIRAHGWDWIGAAHSNLTLDHFQLAQWWHHLGHQPIERISLRSSKGSHTYATRYRVGRLRRYPDPVLAVISKRTRRDFRPVYFLSSDTHLSVRCLLKYYGFRWQAEVNNFYLKERLGLADYRLQSIEAILNWHALVFAAYAFMQTQRAQPLFQNPKATLPTVGDCLVEHQRWHARQMLCHLAALVRQGWSDAQLVAELLP